MKFEAFPRPLRQVAVLGAGYRNRILRYGREFQETRRFIGKSASWTGNEQQQWQAERLCELVAAARAGSSFYSTLPVLDIMKANEDRRLQSMLDTLPLLEKATLKHRGSELVNHKVSRSLRTATSGSTGAPTIIEHDRPSIQRRFAFLAAHLAMAGISLVDPSIRLSGRLLCKAGRDTGKPWLYNAAERQLLLSTYHLDHTHREVITRRVKRLQPGLIDGYPSAILQCLRLLQHEPDSLSALQAVITTAETLAPEVREEMERIARVPVMDYYSASEGVPLIQQCPAGTYHVRWQSGIFEVKFGNGASLEGDGELVATSFVQERMPLIRYCTGDVVTGLREAGEVACNCGLVTPTVDQVEGRIEDMVYTPDGRALGMFTYRTLKWVEGIEESQVIQRDYARFTLRAVLTSSRPEADVVADVKNSFEAALGYPIELELEKVQQLPKGPNGKVRLVISEVGSGDVS